MYINYEIVYVAGTVVIPLGLFVICIISSPDKDK